MTTRIRLRDVLGLVGCWGLVMLALNGCGPLEDWSQYADQNAEQIDDNIQAGAQAVGGALGPATGGLSVLIGGIVSTVASAGLAINRAIVAHRRKKDTDRERGRADAAERVIRAIDNQPRTPSAEDQTDDPADKATVRRARAA